MDEKNTGDKPISVKEARKLIPKSLSERLTDEQVERITNLLQFIATETIYGSN